MPVDVNRRSLSPSLQVTGTDTTQPSLLHGVESPRPNKRARSGEPVSPVDNNNNNTTTMAATAPPAPPAVPEAAPATATGAAVAPPAVPARVREAARRSSLRRNRSTAAGERLFQQAKEREAHLAAARKKKAQQYTFRPRVNKSRRRSSGAQNNAGPRHDRLYQQAAAQRKRRQELAAQRDEAAKSELTFSPQINKRRSGNTTAPAGSNRFEALFRDAEKRAANAKARAEANNQHTFSPQITKRAQRAKTGGKPSERLYAQAKAQQRRQREAREAAAKPAYSFKPKIHGYRSASTPRLRPGARTRSSPQEFAKRQAEADASRRARLKAAAKERQQQMRKELTFKPRLSKRSAKIMKQRQSTEPVHVRLHAESQAIAARRAEKARLQQEQERSRSRPARRRPHTASTSEDGQTLWDRLHADRKRKQEQIAAARAAKEAAEMAECTFVPTVGKRSGSAEAAEGNVWSRLYKDTEETLVRDKMRQKMKEAAELENCTFKPTISSRSSSRVRERSGNIWEELHNRKKDDEKLHELAANLELADCTFKPTISKRAQRRQSSEPAWVRLSVDRSDQIAAREAARLKAELDGCTFKPDVTALKKTGKRYSGNTAPKDNNNTNNDEPDVFTRLQRPTSARAASASAPAPAAASTPRAPVPSAAAAAASTSPAVATAEV